jgi:hypothetical protein
MQHTYRPAFLKLMGEHQVRTGWERATHVEITLHSVLDGGDSDENNNTKIVFDHIHIYGYTTPSITR